MKTISSAELDAILARAIEVSSEPLLELDLTEHDLAVPLADLDVLDLPPPSDKPGPPPARPARARASRASTKISIRIPGWMLNGFKDRAGKTGSKYQAEMKRALRAALLR